MTIVKFIGTAGQHKQACRWCSETIGPVNENWSAFYTGLWEYRYKFNNEGDATMFALRWL